MREKKVNPRRIPLAKSAIHEDAIIEEAVKDDMAHAWLLVAGALLDAGYELAPLASAVNEYITRASGKNRKQEMLRAEETLGIVHPDLKHCRIKSPVELEAFKRKVKSVAVNTALCVVYLGLETMIPADELKRVFFSADLTLAEVNRGLTNYEEIQQELLKRAADLGQIEST